MDKDIKTKRSSNFELLRIITMISIIMYHITCHCVEVQLKGGDSVVNAYNNLFSYPFFYKKIFLVNGMMPVGNVGNLIFLLISGYFLIDKKQINIIKTTKKLLFQLLFATILLVLGSNIVLNLLNNMANIMLIDISFLNSNAPWYVGYYFIVILIAYLFLNKWLNSINQEKYLTFLIILFAFTQFYWTRSFFGEISDYLTPQLIGIFSYSVGGFIKKYNPFKNLKTSLFVLIILLVYLMMYISSYNISAYNIRSFLLKPNSSFIPNVLWYDKSSFLVVILAISVFEIFCRIKLPTNKIINFVASSTFMIYLIHDNVFFYGLWGMRDWTAMLYYNPLKYILFLIIYGLAMFVIGFFSYCLYLLTKKVITSSKKLFIKTNN